MTAASPMPEEPVDLDALFAQALRDHRAGQLAEAAAAYQKIIDLRPGVAEVHSNLGMLLWHQGHPDEAMDSFEQALALNPGLADPYESLGKALRQQDRPERIASRLDRALAEAQALKLGTVLRREGRFDEAAARLEQALALDPNLPAVHYNLGVIFWHRGHLDQAVARYEQAVALKPDYIEALNNLGSTLREQGKPAESRQVFERLLALDPDSAAAQMALGVCYLLAGDYERGWPAYEARLRLPGPSPAARLSPLGRRALGRTQPAVGGGARLGRYDPFPPLCPALKAMRARVVLAAQATLGRLLSSQANLDEFVPLGSDSRASALRFLSAAAERAGRSGTRRGDDSPRNPLPVGRSRVDRRWCRELAGIDGMRIGIVWQGSREYISDRWRSFPLASFAPLARLPGVRLVSLQKGLARSRLPRSIFRCSIFPTGWTSRPALSWTRRR